MKKSKCVVVTVLIAAMVAVIDIGLYLLYTPGAVALTGTLALYGFLHSAGDLMRWLSNDKDAYTVPCGTHSPATDKKHELFDWEKEEQADRINSNARKLPQKRSTSPTNTNPQH